MNESHNKSLLTDDNKHLRGCQIICHRYYTDKTNPVTVYSLPNKPAEMEQMLLACTRTGGRHCSVCSVSPGRKRRSSSDEAHLAA